MRRALAALLLLAACGRSIPGGPPQGEAGGAPPLVRDVEKLAFVPDAVEVAAGETAPIEVWGRTPDGWESLAEDPALGFEVEGEAFDFNGRAVLGLAAGDGVLVARRGDLEARAPIHVRPPRQPVALELVPPSLTVLEGGSLPVRVLRRFDDGSEDEVTGEGGTVLAIEGPAGVAHVVGSAVVGDAPGQATLVASHGGLRATAPVTVVERGAELFQLGLEPDGATIDVGERLAVRVLGHYVGGATEDLTDLASFAVEPPGILDARGNVFTGRSPGEARVRASLEELVTSMTVHVVPGEQGRVVALDVRPSAIEGRPGDRVALTVIASYEDGSERDVTAASTGTRYESAERTVVSVGADGEVFLVTRGFTVVGVTHGTIRVDVPVDVRGPRLIGFALNPDVVELVPGGQVALLAIGTYDDGSQADLACASAFGVEPSDVAEVGACGVVTARAPGEAIVTAFSPGGRFDARARLAVR